MSNLPDRLGDSDTSALLKHGRAYGVTAAIAVGAIAYMSGGISGLVMGGAVAPGAAAVAAACAATYPNMPAGMDSVFNWDGTTKAASTGWTGPDLSADTAEVEVLVDATNPGCSGSVLRFKYPIGSNSAGSYASNSFTSSILYDTTYVMFRIKYDAAWEAIGHKLPGYYGAPRNNAGVTHGPGRGNAISSPTQFFTTRESSDKFNFSEQNGATAGTPIGVFDAWSGVNGNWAALEMLFIAESTVSADDGKFFAWLDGVLVDSATALDLTPNGATACDGVPCTEVGVGGYQWYTTRNDANTIASFYDVGEFLFMGKGSH